MVEVETNHRIGNWHSRMKYDDANNITIINGYTIDVHDNIGTDILKSRDRPSLRDWWNQIVMLIFFERAWP